MKKPATLSSSKPVQEIAIDSRGSNSKPKANQTQLDRIAVAFADCTQLYDFLGSTLMVMTNSIEDTNAVCTFTTGYDALCDAVLEDDGDEAFILLLRVVAECRALVERIRGGSVVLLFSNAS